VTEHVYWLRDQMKIEPNEGEQDCILIDAHTGAMCTCNASATILLQRLRDGATAQELVEVMVQSFEIAEDVATADTKSFLQSLNAMGAVELSLDRSRAA